MGAKNDEVPAEVLEAVQSAEHQLPLLATEQPPALAALYQDLPADVVRTCEVARIAMRACVTNQLRKVRDALAPYGKFREWCEAAGLNYNTANSALRRDSEKQSGGGASHNPSPGGESSGTEDGKTGHDTGDREDKGKNSGEQPREAILKLTFKDETDRKRATDGLHKVIEDKHATTYEEALLYLVDAYAGWVTPAAAPVVLPVPARRKKAS